MTYTSTAARGTKDVPHQHASRRLRFLPAPAAPWDAIAVAHGWTLCAADEDPDVVVRLDDAGRDAGRAFGDAGIIHLASLATGGAYGGNDVELFDPTPSEFLSTCERMLRLARARRLASEYVWDVLECIEDAFFVVDWDRFVVYQNARAIAFIAGLQGEDGDIVGEPLAAHVPPELHNALAPSIAATLRGTSLSRFEVHLPRTDTWVEATVFFIPSGAAVYFRDVTARKNAASAALATVRAGSARETLSAASALAAAVEREIEGPLATLEAALPPSSAPRGAADALKQLRGTVARLGKASRLAPHRAAILDLRSVVAHAIENASRPERDHIRTHLEATPPIEGDEGELGAAVGSLLQTAIESTRGRSGAIVVSTGATPGHATVTIQDDGLAAGADRYWVVDQIVRGHGGAFTASPVAPAGTRCTIQLPLPPEAST